VYGTSAITAITAQNTRGVSSWQPVGSELVRAQIDAVAVDLRPNAVKSGMLAEASIVRVVAAALREHRLTPYVLDPVLVATSGVPLTTPEARAAIRSDLLPLADVVTPNLSEAEALTGEPVRDVAGMGRAARALVERGGARAALVTGGHLAAGESDGMVVDVWFDGSAEPQMIRHPRIDTRHTHGTGCTLSAAITARLALGDPPPLAIRRALVYVHRAIRTAPGLGAGAGPLNHSA
jgi:hydroxymethylpyrimidine/phosphomethylpyrimidine kinase